MADWRKRTNTGAARLRAYYDVIPDRDSRLTLDPGLRNGWGDPMPKLTFVDAQESVELREHTEASIHRVFDRIVQAGGGRVLREGVQNVYDHPGGGCRMGDDPASSVVVSGGCANGTLTFSAMALRSAEVIGKA